ncbi:UDP-N-acetylmuramoylalanyl-D-glutamyl-2,6- diaminopimelate--D-alanyl-D- alanyl ligase [Flavobacteriaceae bacterium 3519-10]|nr:UDP-N-acetylmuramoylalanyl-D-glutamyl-2,6- diaminopimelate--D-alanyl-D- alanyl ligase [Flavobacteriaceae bacterium 3519-10]
MNYTTLQLSEITGSELIGDGKLCVTGMAYDSRNIFSPLNTAFLAINTAKNSGEKYITSAIEKGISVVISQHRIESETDVTWIIVEDSLKFIQKLAKYHFAQFTLKTTIGITGSNGKTIVKEWLYQSLFDEFITVKSPKSFNSQLGLPLSLLKVSARDEIGIFEVGISKPSEMERLADIFKPQIGVLTHIGPAHESNFENQKQLIEEKIKLFSDSDVILFNGDNLLVHSLITERYSSKKLISYGFETHNDIFIKSSPKEGDLSIVYFGEEFNLPAQRRDEATLNNALCVIAVLKVLGFSTDIIREKINMLKPVEMRLESVKGLRNNLIINDYYNLDLDSLKIAFQFINEYNKPAKTLVLTDFVEGKETTLLYQTVSNLTNQQKFQHVFLIGDEITKYSELFEGDVAVFNNTTQLIESHYLDSVENELILLKGARKFEIEKVKDHLELQKHDTVLEVNLNAVLHNINVHKSLLKPKTKMMAMVKAYSYGLGGYEIAEFLQHHHIDYLGVAYADEGADLRKNGISVPIMVMNPEQHSYDSIIEHHLEPEIYSFRVLDLFNQQLIRKGADKDYPIHIKLETGMNRLGFREDEIDELAARLAKMDVKVASVFSHLSTADSEEEHNYTMHQIEKFQSISTRLAEKLKYEPIRHILNSSGIANYADYQFEMVRIGIGMVGITSNEQIKNQLRNVVSFKSVISQISEINAGDSVGYDRKYKATKRTRIATIPVGYADGVPRMIGNGIGHVSISGNLYPIVGNICMDMMMVEVGDSSAKEGDEVIIFNSKPSLAEFSDYCKTIPYEVLTSISRRVKRVYIKD